MTKTNEELLLIRIEKLEARSRRFQITAMLSLIFPILAIVGWQSTPAKLPKPTPLLRVQKLEVVDAKGKLLVSMGYDNWTKGGRVAIYDENGERKGWWRASPIGAHLMMVGTSIEGKETSSVSIQADDSKTSSSAGLRVIGPKSAMLTAGVNSNKPTLAMYAPDSKVLFEAPSAGK